VCLLMGVPLMGVPLMGLYVMGVLIIGDQTPSSLTLASLWKG